MSGPIKVGVAGLGTVGTGVLKILQDSKDDLSARCGRQLEVSAVSARDQDRDRGVSLDGITWHKVAPDIANDDNVDVVLELIGGEDGPAKALVERALDLGKPVVTANKALIAHHGAALSALAEANGVALRFEAAVAGGVPIIKALGEGMAANDISRVYGILNGTCNYILTTMEETGRSFDDVLAEAQSLGYAEADPTFDVDGIDTAHKLAILTSVAFGAELDLENVYTEGIRQITPLDIEIARELGYRIKLLGLTSRTGAGIKQRVHPCLVSLKAAIAHVGGAFNGIVVEGTPIGQTTYEGPGAGAGPTASAVVADLIDIARGNLHPAFGVPSSALSAMVPVAIERHEARFYVRLSVADRPGVMAAITAALRDQEVSIETMLQRAQDKTGGETQNATVVIVTHETNESNIRASIEQVGGLDFIAEPPELIRIEAL